MSHQTVAVLAVQGAFIEHERRLEQLGAQCIELRQASDLEKAFDRLVLPGGESTAQAKMLHDLGMFEPLRVRIKKGLPVLATCAGLILLAEHLEGDPTVHFGTLPVTVRRNAYGRQLGSFHAEGAWHSEVAPSPHGQAGQDEPVPTTFIRAPRITKLHGTVKPLVTLPDGTVAAVLSGSQLACAFHPELDGDTHIHKLFLSL